MNFWFSSLFTWQGFHNRQDEVSDKSIDRNGGQLNNGQLSSGQLKLRQDKQELELQLAKAHSQIDHVRSQNDVLELTLDDAKSTNEKLSIYMARHESNGTAMQLALAYADQVCRLDTLKKRPLYQTWAMNEYGAI